MTTECTAAGDAPADPCPLRDLRIAAHLTQREVADAVNREMGIAHSGPVTAGAVSRWERRLNHPRPRYRRALAAIFSTTVEALGFAATHVLTEAAR